MFLYSGFPCYGIWRLGLESRQPLVIPDDSLKSAIYAGTAERIDLILAIGQLVSAEIEPATKSNTVSP